MTVRVERFVYDDAIVRMFLVATVGWGVVGMAVGLLVALQLVHPLFNLDTAWLSFGRLRPLHTNAVIFAFAGVAVHGGAEAALATADVFATRPGVAPVADLLDGACRTVRVVRRNLVFSLAYNAAGVALAMAGWLNPLVAAVLMPLSSLTVVVSSYRARTFAVPEDRAWR